jgi:hypothetical protein
MRKVRDVRAGGHDAWRVQSTGEKLAVAVVLDRADWIVEMDYTLAEAIDRIGLAWMRSQSRNTRLLLRNFLDLLPSPLPDSRKRAASHLARS